jgi:hypothetical protein
MKPSKQSPGAIAVAHRAEVTELAGKNGRAFALAESAISRPETYSFDCNLNIVADPLA